MSRNQLKWEATDLERRLCHALDIAALTVERFASDGYADQQDRHENLLPEKVISETALLLLAAATAGNRASIRTRIHAVAQRLIPHARGPRMRLGLCLTPALALDYGSAHICLHRLGYPDADFDTLLHQTVCSQAARGRERPPHRMLEHEWLMENWFGGTDMRARTLSSARISVLNSPMDLLRGSRDDLYAFTHALMYVRDFNIHPRRLPRSRAAILAEADAALARCLDEEDYDLAGEVLLAWPLTGRSWSVTAAFGFRVLARVEDTAGFLPSPGTRLQHLAELEGDTRTDYLFATAYHTIYVMGLLCAAALQPERTPPSTLPSGRGEQSAATAILTVLDHDDRCPHWRQELDSLTAPERDSLEGFLLNVALCRKVSQRDFGAVAGLLRLGLAAGLTDTPCASQAAEMLARLAMAAPALSDPDRKP